MVSLHLKLVDITALSDAHAQYPRWFVNDGADRLATLGIDQHSPSADIIRSVHARWAVAMRWQQCQLDILVQREYQIPLPHRQAGFTYAELRAREAYTHS